jgi:hypothetical protein
MKKTTRSFDELPDEAKEYAALVEPLSGHSDAEVVRLLQKLGASKTEILSPRFISTHATGAALQQVNRIAHVHLKREKESHW